MKRDISRSFFFKNNFYLHTFKLHDFFVSANFYIFYIAVLLKQQDLLYLV